MIQTEYWSKLYSVELRMMMSHTLIILLALITKIEFHVFFPYLDNK